MSAGRVLVTPRSLTSAGLDTVVELDPVRARGYQLVSGPPGRAPTTDQLRELLPGCSGWIAGVEPIPAEVLADAPQLRVISRNGTGTDAIDLDAAARAGVSVVRATAANAQGVAELVLALVLCCLRDVVGSATALREGRWERTIGSELAERTIGLVGLGAVGQRVARSFAALGATVVGHDPAAPTTPVPLVGLEELAATADVVSLSCPPPADGRPIVDADLLALAPRGTVLVNTARAGLVDDRAVLEALDAGVLGAYAVDAFATEPPEPSPLLGHPRVVATPHVGGYTTASVRRATRTAVANLLDALEAP
jgi:D-3-phosphoglycerate dehydrogenase / 2-oxoglutarate reductase